MSAAEQDDPREAIQEKMGGARAFIEPDNLPIGKQHCDHACSGFHGFWLAAAYSNRPMVKPIKRETRRELSV